MRRDPEGYIAMSALVMTVITFAMAFAIIVTVIHFIVRGP